MKNIIKYLLVSIFAISLAVPALAKQKTEEEVLTDMDSPTAKVAVSGLAEMEKQYPTSTAGLAKTKTLLADERVTVREKAARVLGALHADVNETDLANICKLLQGETKTEIIEGLKALRGLKAQSTVPKILPLLKNPDENVKRDACRTLAVLGDKSIIPDIQPLLKDPNSAVVKDANDAIFELNSK